MTNPRRQPKVVVAMSGGVDSSVAAALLQRDGYEVVGCFMRLGSVEESPDACAHPRSPAGAEVEANTAPQPSSHGCCSLNDAADAREVAAILNIPFYVLNFRDDFGRIMDYFTAEYHAGRTPNPCVRCNDWLKFGKLWNYAQSIQADFVATGHYARIQPAPGSTPASGSPPAIFSSPPRGETERGASDASTTRAIGIGMPPTRLGDSTPTDIPSSFSGVLPGAGAHLLRGVDHAKDQSYVLFGIHPERLARLLLPIGTYRKPEIRALAQQFGLPVHDKPDSQEICFVLDNDYRHFLAQRDPDRLQPGKLVDTDGKPLGTHGGHQLFTIGQRRGIGVAQRHPLYVLNKNPATNTVTVGPKDQLYATRLTARDINWLVPRPEINLWIKCQAKIRYNTPPAEAEVRITDADRLEVRFAQPVYAISPGQAVVCYDGDIVLGGAWIEKAQ